MRWTSSRAGSRRRGRAGRGARRADLQFSGDWPAKQLGTLERNVLRIGVHELQEGTVPLEVAIDEAVSLAKRYASEDAGRLVNGILGAIAREQA